ncbi:MAG: hypothetical protein IT366_24005 [Candidatus Hydrogenedentes bacterium]|nr:hypothetical protein [Candidatus Hydrogenedentota bacterium]
MQTHLDTLDSWKQRILDAFEVGEVQACETIDAAITAGVPLPTEHPGDYMEFVEKWCEQPATEAEFAAFNAHIVDRILDGEAEARRANWYKAIDMEVTRRVAEEVGLNFAAWLTREYARHECLAADRDKQFILAVWFHIDALSESEDERDISIIESLSDTAMNWYEEVHTICGENYEMDYAQGVTDDEARALYPELDW